MLLVMDAVKLTLDLALLFHGSCRDASAIMTVLVDFDVLLWASTIDDLLQTSELITSIAQNIPPGCVSAFLMVS